MTPFEIRI